MQFQKKEKRQTTVRFDSHHVRLRTGEVQRKPAAICTAGQISSESVIPYTLQHWKISGSRRNRFLLISMTALKPISKYHGE